MITASSEHDDVRRPERGDEQRDQAQPAEHEVAGAEAPRDPGRGRGRRPLDGERGDGRARPLRRGSVVGGVVWVMVSRWSGSGIGRTALSLGSGTASGPSGRAGRTRPGRPPRRPRPARWRPAAGRGRRAGAGRRGRSARSRTTSAAASGVVGVDQDGGLPHQLGDPADPGRHERDAGEHRLLGHERTGLPARREEDQVGRGVPGRDVVARADQRHGQALGRRPDGPGRRAAGRTPPARTPARRGRASREATSRRRSRFFCGASRVTVTTRTSSGASPSAPGAARAPSRGAARAGAATGARAASRAPSARPGPAGRCSPRGPGRRRARPRAAGCARPGRRRRRRGRRCAR